MDTNWLHVVLLIYVFFFKSDTGHHATHSQSQYGALAPDKVYARPSQLCFAVAFRDAIHILSHLGR